MRKLQIAPFVSTTVGFDVKSGTFDFIQQCHQETTSSQIISLIGSTYDSTKVYILSGCIFSSTAGNSVSAGSVFFNGEIYLCDTQSGIGGAGTFTTNAILTITQYSPIIGGVYTADPGNFSDGSSHNVHNIRKITWSTSSVGSLTGDSNSLLSNMINIITAIQNNLLIPANTISSLVTINTSIGIGTWQNITLGTGYTVFRPVQYRLDGQGRVYIRGQLIAGSGATLIMFQLPAISALFPTQGMDFVCRKYSGTTESNYNVNVSVTGEFDSSYTPASGDHISVDGIIYFNS